MITVSLSYQAYVVLLFIAACVIARWIMFNDPFSVHEPLMMLALFLLGFLAALGWVLGFPVSQPAAPLLSPSAIHL